MDLLPPTAPAITSVDALPPSSSSSSLPSTLTPTPTLPPQELILLCGLIGSFLFSPLVQLLPPTSTRRQWVRVNQDELGDRKTCEAIARSALAKGQNVLIDRQNFDRAQRKVWVGLAREFRGVRVGAWVMGTSLDDCNSRLVYRHDHPTIKDAQLGIRLLNQFQRQWQEPHPNEVRRRIEHVQRPSTGMLIPHPLFEYLPLSHKWQGFDRLMILPPLPPSNAMTRELLESLRSQLWSPPPHTAPRQVQNNGTFGPAPIVSPWNHIPSSYKPSPGKGQMSLDSFGFARQTPGPPPPPPFRR